MTESLKNNCQTVLDNTVAQGAGVPGVVAMVTGRDDMLFSGAAGNRATDGAPMTEDTVFAIFSCTKGLTATAVMTLVDQGKIDLDAPAQNYAPGLAEIGVLSGFDDAGVPQIREPASPVTTRQLLLHTAGFGYDFFNENYLRLAEADRLPSVVTSSKSALQAPLLFDPGTRWEYGINMDWAGQVVEGVTGMRLGEYLQQLLFEPLGMNDSSFLLREDMIARLACIHQREENGSLTCLSDFRLPQPPEVDMGGHGLYSTVGDYMKFLRMLLNGGMGPNGRVLSEAQVEAMTQNGLGDMKITPLPGVIPTLSNDAEFFPGLPKSWSYSFMINDEEAPTGRPAGAQGWAGLANLFYWFDRENGVAGFWATQILPFADPASFTGYMAFEQAVYDSLKD